MFYTRSFSLFRCWSAIKNRCHIYLYSLLACFVTLKSLTAKGQTILAFVLLHAPHPHPILLVQNFDSDSTVWPDSNADFEWFSKTEIWCFCVFSIVCAFPLCPLSHCPHSAGISGSRIWICLLLTTNHTLPTTVHNYPPLTTTTY